MAVEPDFSGYATKAGLRCSDGRIIKPEAFQHMDGVTVPLVWQHGHSEPTNVLGHAVLEARPDGVYAQGYFNDTPNGQHAKTLVQHRDINKLSIYANQLVEKTKQVLHGVIREVSLVLAGANPGAKIDYVRIQHSLDPDDFTVLEEEAIIHTGLTIDLRERVEEKVVEENQTETKTDSEDEVVEHSDAEKMSFEDIYEAMSDEQKSVLHYMVGKALDVPAAEHTDDNEGAIAHQEGTSDMTRNVFENGAGGTQNETQSLSHDDMKGIVASAVKMGSLKEAVQAYALAHGIENIEALFPDAKNITGTPELNKRRTEWVASVLNGTRSTPFSRVKTLVADLTQDEARAKGYIKGEYKKEEWIGVTKRTTTPTTVYKKQKLDRDDILDITDFDVVAWLKAEIRLMLEEEVARAIMIGDGRDVSDDDKIKDPIGASDGAGVRSIANDHEVYVTTLNVNLDDANSTYEEVVDRVMDGMEYYKGTGTPTFYTTIKHLNGFKKAKDLNGQRYYKNNEEVAEALGVDRIVTVEPMNDVADLVGIIVNLSDYNIGADKGGEVTLFDDFDIDYNQFKYLMETRLSGALTKVKSALVIRKVASGAALVVPLKPSFVSSTGVVTIPTVTGVVYKNAAGTTLTAGAQSALAAGDSLVVNAVPASGSYYFSDTAADGPWTFKRPAV